MSLFQCVKCGCCENTACCNYHYNRVKHAAQGDLCSACDPHIGKWHGKFDRVYLPPGQFKTNGRGNLEHIASGREDFRAFAVEAAP